MLVRDAGSTGIVSECMYVTVAGLNYRTSRKKLRPSRSRIIIPNLFAHISEILLLSLGMW